MSPTDAPAPTLDSSQTPPAASPPPLSWPPPGLEAIQGKLWRTSATIGAGAIAMVSPLLWALAVTQPFWSLGPFEDHW